VNSLRSILLCCLVLGAGALSARAQQIEAVPTSTETVKSVLIRNKGNRVSLRFASGEELAGKVASVGDQSVYLTELAGREFFDAVVALDDVTAVVFRAKGK
jgi:hypothetical protein